MHINRKDILSKLRKKNQGNARLAQTIDQLISDFEGRSATFDQVLKIRKDADKVHNAGFYFFNILTYRTLVFIDQIDDSADIVWAGSHEEYVSIFKNNKNRIEKWLRSNNWIP